MLSGIKKEICSRNMGGILKLQYFKRKVGAMNSKQIILLTTDDLGVGVKEQRKDDKKGRKITTCLVMLMMTLLFSCMPIDGSVAFCSAKEKVKVTKEVKTSKKNSRKKKAAGKKVSNKKTSNKKSVSKKAAVKKTSSKKSVSKKTAVKKTSSKKSARKKAAAKKTSKKKVSSKKNARKKKSFKERYTVYGTPEKNSFKSYMSYKAVSRTSAQGKLQAKAKTDSKTGIRKVDGRYCVALGSYYCSKIGTKIDLVMANGSVVKCILADQKANRDTDAKNQKTSDGSIAEFLVDMDELPYKAKIMGNVSYALKELRGSISKVRVYE